MKPKILLIGGGGHCKAVIDVIEQEGKYTIAGIVDKKELLGKEVLGYKIIACDNALERLFQSYDYALITVGSIYSNSVRVKLFEQLKKIGYTFPVIISPLAYVSQHAFVDEGSIIMHHALLNADVRVGKNCIINTKALLEHEVSVGDHSHISTASVVNGGVTIKADTFFGSNATAKESIQISHFIKAGTLVQ